MVLKSTVKDRKRGPRGSAPSASVRLLVLDGAPRRDPPQPLRAGSNAIGRGVGKNGITIDDERVSRTHAAIELDTNARTATLRDTSSTGTEVNGEPVTERVLEDGDVIFLGSSALLYRASDPDGDSGPSFDLVGDAPAMRTMRRAIQQIGASDATVLLHGETGTGKELAARALHAASKRGGEFVPVNCSAIPATLAEAQLFGHLAGSYTGARTPGSGLFRAADGGTLFLDELADLSLEIQPKLLRVLEDRVVTPVGATRGAPVDVRVIAATNADLLAAVDAGRFRGDLYARLSDFVLEMPPLRARREDVLPILVRALGEGAPPLAADLVRALLLYEWPFNVRELLKVATQLKVAGEGAAEFDLSLLGGRLGRAPRSQAPSPSAPPRSAVPPSGVPPSAVPPSAVPPSAVPVARPALDAAPSRAELEALLRRHRGVVALVARETGRSRKQVYRWIEQHGLEIRRYRA